MSRAACLVAALAAWSAGCGWSSPASPDPPLYESGKRLRIQTIGADGAALFVGWHDSGPPDADCAFTLSGDGETRCLPSGPDVGFSSNYFEDASCQLDLAFPANSPEPRFARRYDDCGRVTVRRVTGPAEPSATIYTLAEDGTCAPSSNMASPLFRTEAVPASDFVAATIERRSRGKRLALESLHGDDGSVEARTIVDTERDTPCNLRFPGSLRCVPDRVAWIFGEFADASCKKPAAEHYQGDPTCPAPAPIAALDFPGNGSPWDQMGCSPPPPSLFEIGHPIDGTIYNASPSCTAEGPPSPQDSHYTVGASIPTNSLPALATHDAGKGRIVLRTLTADTGEPLLQKTLFDTERGEECNAGIAGDGVTRCLPAALGQGASGYFVDSACTELIVTANAGCAAPALVAGGSSAVGTDVLVVGAKLTGIQPWQKVTGGCAPAPIPMGVDLYRAEVLPPAELAELTEATE